MAKKRIEIVRRIVAVIALVLGIAWNGLAETVENVRGQQRENSKLVDIYYDLNDTCGGTYYVEVEIVGRTSDVNASSFSGDVGEGVAPGQDRHIVWDAGADWPGNKGDVKAVVTAIKGGKPNKVQLWEGGPYWADRNIGADAPWEYGLYFWWGDTVGVTGQTFSGFPSKAPTYGKDTSSLQSEGWTTADGVLSANHDAAHIQWGAKWRMPTRQELSNLIANCSWTWMTTNGVGGYIVRGRGEYATASIFLPAAGYADGYGNSIDFNGCHYQSSSPHSGNHFSWALFSGNPEDGRRMIDTASSRVHGLSVRPVQDFSK